MTYTTSHLINILTKTPAQAFMRAEEETQEQTIGRIIHARFLGKADEHSKYCFLEQGQDGRSRVAKEAKASGFTVVNYKMQERVERAMEALGKNKMAIAIAEQVANGDYGGKFAGNCLGIEFEVNVDVFYEKDGVGKMCDLKTIGEMPLIDDLIGKISAKHWDLEMWLREVSVREDLAFKGEIDWAWLFVSTKPPYEVRYLWIPHVMTDRREVAKSYFEEAVKRLSYAIEKGEDVCEFGGDEPIVVGDDSLEVGSYRPTMSKMPVIDDEEMKDE